MEGRFASTLLGRFVEWLNRAYPPDFRQMPPAGRTETAFLPMAQYLFTDASELDGGLFLLNSQNGEVSRLLTGSYRGLTRGPDGAWYLVTGSRSRPNRVVPPHAAIYRMDPGSWKTDLVEEYPLGDAHDLRWMDGYFYLVSCIGNQIVRLDEQLRVLDRMQIMEDDRDTCHVNCLGKDGDRYFCSVFNLRPGDRREKRHTPAWYSEGKILLLDYPNRRFDVLYEPLGQPHSLVARGSSLYLVESALSRITRLDLRTRTTEVLATYNGFVRGLCFGPGEALVGVSLMMRNHRKRARPQARFARLWEKFFPFAGVMVVDPETWRIRRRFPLPNSQPYDIHPLEPVGAPAPVRTPALAAAGR